MFISDAFAQVSEAAAGGSGSFSGTLLFQMILIFLVCYVLIIRPQQKKFKQHEALLMSIKKGDKIITGGGIYGKVVKADDSMELLVEIADGLNVTINRATVRDVVNDENIKMAKIETKPAKSKAKPANSNAQDKHKK